MLRLPHAEPTSRRSIRETSAAERFWETCWAMNASSKSSTRSATIRRRESFFSAARSRPSSCEYLLGRYTSLIERHPAVGPDCILAQACACSHRPIQNNKYFAPGRCNLDAEARAVGVPINDVFGRNWKGIDRTLGQLQSRHKILRPSVLPRLDIGSTARVIVGSTVTVRVG